MDRAKKLIYNTASSVALRLVTIMCGFVLPRLILATYGSAVNGLIASISQFLSIISFMEFGVGAVIRSALYKPIADKDQNGINSIIVSGQKFFTKIAYFLIVYVIVLIIAYPFIINAKFDWMYTDTLIVAISFSYFAQYYLGIIDGLFLTSSQMGYIQNCSEIISLIINLILCIVLIKAGCSIQVVKLISSGIFLLKPLAIRFYINKKYNINRKYSYKGEPIKQKWNGLAQHISAVVLDGTDTIILTIFSTLENVSIYAVYNLVLAGLKQMLISFANGIQSLMGDMIAKDEKNKLANLFQLFEYVQHIVVVYIFSCTTVLIVPFVLTYTKGITGANYYQPFFATIITLACAVSCLSVPYNIAILAAGHYKQTQKYFIICTTINLIVSIVSVFSWGLVGVAIGTLTAMLYQILWMAVYVSKYIINWPFKCFIKQCVVDGITAVLIIVSTSWINADTISYISWFILACKVAGIAFVVVVIMSIIFYRHNVNIILDYL